MFEKPDQSAPAEGEKRADQKLVENGEGIIGVDYYQKKLAGVYKPEMLKAMDRMSAELPRIEQGKLEIQKAALEIKARIEALQRGEIVAENLEEAAKSLVEEWEALMEEWKKLDDEEIDLITPVMGPRKRIELVAEEAA